MSQIILRPASQAMDLERLGAGFSSNLSFMRTLVRHMVKDQWAISYSQFELDQEGYGVEAKKWIDLGATIIGGCCRTRPEHIKKLRKIIG